MLRASHTGPYATMLTKMRAARRELRQTVVPRRIPPRSQFSTIFSGGKSCPRCANFNQLPRPPKNARVFNLSFYSNETNLFKFRFDSKQEEFDDDNGVTFDFYRKIAWKICGKRGEETREKRRFGRNDARSIKKLARDSRPRAIHRS